MHASSKVGIICGDGSLPQSLVAACQAQGRAYVLIVLEGVLSSDWYQGHPHHVCRLGAIGSILKLLKKESVSTVTLAGALKRPSLKELRPDFTAMKWLARLGLRSSGDDGLLSGILGFLKEEGFSVQGAHEIAPDLLASMGEMAQPAPKQEDVLDIQKGVRVAKELGRLDVGQAVIVENGVVLSVEGIEGTAALLERTAALKRDKKGVGVLVKMSKPQQSLLVDLPSIGPDTIRQVMACGLSGIAVEAGKSLVLEKEKTLNLANEAGLFVVGVDEGHDTPE